MGNKSNSASKTNTLLLTPHTHQEYIERIKKINTHDILKIKSQSSQSKNGIRKIIYSPHSKQLITGEIYGTLVSRDINNYSIINEIEGHTKMIRNLTILRDGRLASCSDDKTIKIRDLKSFTCKNILEGHTDIVTCIIELEKDNMIMTGSFDKAFMVWDLKRFDTLYIKPVFKMIHRKQDKIFCMMLLNWNEIAISSCENINIYHFDKNFCSRYEIIKILKGHLTIVYDLKLVNDKKNLMLSSEYSYIKLWSVHSGTCLRNFRENYGGFAISLFTNRILMSIGKSIEFWDIYTGKHINSIPIKNIKLLFCYTHIDQNTIIFAGISKNLLLVKI